MTMERGDRASRRNGSLAAFLVLEDRSTLVAGDTLSGCVEVSANSSLRIASAAVGLVFYIGLHEPASERTASPGDWHIGHILAESLEIERTARIPFSLRLPLAPISCSDPLPIQCEIVARVVTEDGRKSTDCVPMFVRPAPLSELHAGSRGDPYRTPPQNEITPSSMRLEQISTLLVGRPEAEPVLAALSPRNQALARLPVAAHARSPLSVASLGEVLVVSDADLDTNTLWTLCCRHHPTGSNRDDRIVCRIEPNDVVDQRESGGGRKFRLVVPRDGPPSFAIGQESVRWSLVVEARSAGGGSKIEYPLVVLPFIAQHPFMEDVSSSWPRRKLARALRRIRAAKGS